MYERKIIYLHRYEGEVDKGNAGYIKQEVCNGIYTFTVMLMNLPPYYETESYLMVAPGEHSVCKVHIGNGKGQGLAICEEKTIGKNIEEYIIKVSDDNVIKGKPSVIKKGKEEVKPIEKTKEISDVPIVPQQNSVVCEVPEEIFKTKWDQLSYGKKKVNLMGKESEYIEITPSDMIALNSPYHSLVNNAFLLHGYYNYKHLILGPANGQKSAFFIGVPGNFYKQEVNAARMFGFEYFENGGNKVEVGDFGYYMKKVKL